MGSILLDNEAINVVQERLEASDFYRAAHKAIFEAMAELTDKREPIDIVTLSQALRARGTFEQCGGMENLARLAALVPSSANAGFYAKAVKEMSLRRSAIHVASEMITSAFNTESDVSDFIDEIEQKILGISDKRLHTSFYRVGEVVQESIRMVEQLYDRKQPVTGVPTGFNGLNHYTAGFQPSDLVIIAARPSMGKTALALTIAQHVGIHQAKAIAIFSLEMSKEQIVLRMLCAEAGVENTKVRTGHLGERDFPRLVDAASRIAEAPIFIDDTPALNITEMRAKARRLHRDTPLSAVIVDYLQLMRSPMYGSNREQEISDISRSLKALAKELKIPVIALSQLNRSLESRNDKRPLMSDLRESGAIEQDADLIMFIYRDEVYNQESPDAGVAEIIISKQRSGPTGTVRLAFSPEFTRFAELEEHREPEIVGGETFDVPGAESDLF